MQAIPRIRYTLFLQSRCAYACGDHETILDIDSSNERTDDVWRYGFPYGWFRSSELKAHGDR